jgi:hypothetical protein
MAEPITLTLSALLWEYALKPIADSIKKEYGDETKKLLKGGLQKAFKKLSLQPKERELIEAEIIEADSKVLSDQDRFLEFVQDSNRLTELMSQIEKREPTIHTIIKNSYNEIKIEGSNNSISF